LVTDGACADLIREKLGMVAATASRHPTLLNEAEILIATRKKGWARHRLDERAIADFACAICNEL